MSPLDTAQHVRGPSWPLSSTLVTEVSPGFHISDRSQTRAVESADAVHRTFESAKHAAVTRCVCPTRCSGASRNLDSSQLILHATRDPSPNAAMSGIPHGPNQTPIAPRTFFLPSDVEPPASSRVYAPSIIPVRESNSRTPPPREAVATNAPPGDVATEMTGHDAPSFWHPESTRRGFGISERCRGCRASTGVSSRCGTGAAGRSRCTGGLSLVGGGRAF